MGRVEPREESSGYSTEPPGTELSGGHSGGGGAPGLSKLRTLHLEQAHGGSRLRGKSKPTKTLAGKSRQFL